MMSGRAIALTLALVVCDLGAARASCTAPQTSQVSMRDGTQLATDVYAPPLAGAYPALVYRTPYGRGTDMVSLAQTVCGLGIAAVWQDNRKACVFRCDGDGEAKDGVDTLAWVRAQPWSNGELATYGGSARGIIQYMTAAASPPPAGLRAMWVQVATPQLFDYGFFQGGVFRQSTVEGWLSGIGESAFLAEIAAHPLASDPFWSAVQTTDQFAAVDVPTMHMGGWYDVFSQGTLDAFAGYQHEGGAGARGAQKLIMGPWVHGGDGEPRNEPGELIYPANAMDTPVPGQMALLRLWLEHYLGITPNPSFIANLPAVLYYKMGDVESASPDWNAWFTADGWPIPAAAVRLHLQPAGALAEPCPPAGGATSSFDYEPLHPTPTIGGANLSGFDQSGPYDQSPLESRTDVLVFSTEPLAGAVEVTGRLRVHLWVESDSVDTDIMVRLTDVYPNSMPGPNGGHGSMLVADGAQRLATRAGGFDLLTPGEIVEVVVDLWSTSMVFNAGHRIRISLSASNAPRFWPSENDGSHYPGDGVSVPAHVILHHSAERPSYVELPMPARSGGSVVLCEPTAPACGNLAIEAGESCDPPSSCPMRCDDGDPCTVDLLVGAAASCDARCEHQIGGCAEEQPAEEGCRCVASGASGLGFFLGLLAFRRRR